MREELRSSNSPKNQSKKLICYEPDKAWKDREKNTRKENNEMLPQGHEDKERGKRKKKKERGKRKSYKI